MTTGLDFPKDAPKKTIRTKAVRLKGKGFEPAGWEKNRDSL
jgi:hypothetical protein